MKYDEVLRHRYVYDNLLADYEDATAKPKNNIPVLLPRRKDLNYTADIDKANEVNIKLDGMKLKDGYYNTKVDPLYSLKPIGHDVFNTDITK